jgi:FKBP-type peptidyl-prolyl cis-trans isomerase FklB
MNITNDGMWSRAGATLLLCIAPLSGFAQAPAAAKPAAGAAAPLPLPTADEAGYIIGLNFGAQMQRVGITDEVSVAAIARGVKDGLAGKTSNPADQQRLQEFVRNVMEKSRARQEAKAHDFLVSNGHKPGVKTTASGLEYKVIEPGDSKAASPSLSDTVTVHYRGRLLDGKEFDSSYKRGKPASFPVDAVIKGWQEALVMMKPGAKWQLFVPPELAYGSSPRPGIPPGSLLIFDVNLLSVKATPHDNAPPAGHPNGTP